jgi:hypothetical protein
MSAAAVATAASSAAGRLPKARIGNTLFDLLACVHQTLQLKLARSGDPGQLADVLAVALLHRPGALPAILR